MVNKSSLTGTSQDQDLVPRDADCKIRVPGSKSEHSDVLEARRRVWKSCSVISFLIGRQGKRYCRTGIKVNMVFARIAQPVHIGELQHGNQMQE